MCASLRFCNTNPPDILEFCYDFIEISDPINTMVGIMSATVCKLTMAVLIYRCCLVVSQNPDKHISLLPIDLNCSLSPRV